MKSAPIHHPDAPPQMSRFPKKSSNMAATATTPTILTRRQRHPYGRLRPDRSRVHVAGDGNTCRYVLRLRWASTGCGTVFGMSSAPATLIAACLLSACSPQVEDVATIPVEPTAPAILEAEWLSHTNGPPITSLAARLRGRLNVNIATRCVTVEVTETGTRFAVVFIDGAFLDVTDPSDPVLVRHTGERYEDGAMVEWSGGSWGESLIFAESSDPAYRDVVVPDSCDYDAVWPLAP